MKKTVTLLGSTGSIGQNTLKIIEHLKDDFEVFALAAKSNVSLMEEQARKFCPKIVVLYDEIAAETFSKRNPQIKVLCGMEGLEEIASKDEVDFVLSAMVGAAGIRPTLQAVKKGKIIGLANKEVLISAGEIIMHTAKVSGATILPVDSEHSALFQCLQGEQIESVDRLILTASGGPFRTFSQEKLRFVKPEDALCHPNWSMGKKVTVDSSTLMNKGLEVIEAYWLFGIEASRIDVVIHPQSLIHSFVEFVDGSLLAQIGEPTMLTPIQYALTYPRRKKGLLKRFDFSKFSKFDFMPPDTDKFPCLDLAFAALRKGGSMPCYLNAANEILVERFLNKEISWVDIGEKLEKLMGNHSTTREITLDLLFSVDSLAREDALHV